MTSDSKRPGSFLGTGWSFPPAFGPGGAEVAMVSDAEDIAQSLEILFATRPGERPMRESFGCNLDDTMFEEIDHGLIGRLTALITDAVVRHEPRIAVDDVAVTQDPDDAGVLRIHLAYSVLGTNSRYNMVFPFYLGEATTPGL